MKKFKKFLSIILTVCMVLSLLPMTALAAEWDGTTVATEFDGGSGTSGDPYRIATPEQLAYLANLVNASNTAYNGAYYVLTSDIDLGTNEWTPIGDESNQFKGNFKGNGHTITGTMTTDNLECFGLFGVISSSGIVNNLIVNLDVTSNYENDQSQIGGLAGCSYGTVKNCSASGSITRSVSSGSYVGGLVGWAEGSISNCSSNVDVNNVSGGDVTYTGGLVGCSFGSVINSYSTGAVSSDMIVGGFAGVVFPSGTIKNCYETGAVTQTDSGDKSGGFVGSNRSEIENCYAVGVLNSAYGFAGENRGTITTSFFCNNNGSSTGVGSGSGTSDITGDTMANMKDAAFVSTLNVNCYNTSGEYSWVSDSEVTNGGYPVLSAPVLVSNIAISGDDTITTDGGTLGLGITVEPDFPTSNAYTWSIASGSNYASIKKNGTVTALKNGTVTVAAVASDDGGYMAFHEITISGQLKDWSDNAATAFDGGSGTSGDPYRIATPEQLAYLASLVNTSNTAYNGAYYVLTSDIDLGTSRWTPIGNYDNQFEGNFKGNGHTITGTMTTHELQFFGLFGVIGSNGIVNNLIVNLSVTSQYSGIQAQIGGLAGCSYGTVKNCSASGHVSMNSSSDYEVGGLMGRNVGSISNCSASATVESVTGWEQASAGGLVGCNYGSVINSYSTGTVSCGIGGGFVGGFVGFNYQGTIQNCYETGAVTQYASDYSCSGGFVGNNMTTITNCYAAGARTNAYGFAGGNNDTINTSYFSNDNGGSITSAVCTESGTSTITGYTTAYMQEATFAATLNANCISITGAYAWASDSGTNGGYPVLSAPVLVSGITVTGAGSATSVVNGSTLQMSAAVTPTDATVKSVIWSVVNGTGSATISSSGLLSATGVGTVTVKATANDGSGVIGTLNITVTAATVAVTGITVTGAGSATSVLNGSTLQMSAAVTPTDANDTSVTWSVENGTGSATINSSGLLSATGVGTVTVKATANDSSGIIGTLDITVTAASTSTGSGTTSSSSSGGSSTTTTTTTTVSGSTATTTMAPTVSGGVATGTVTESQMSSALKKAQAAAGTNGTPNVTIQISGASGASSVGTTISHTSMKSLVTGGIGALTISGQTGTVSFDAAALKTIAGASGDVTVSVAKKDSSTLSAAAKALVGSHPVFTFSVTSGGSTVSQFSGDVTVSIPYTPASGEDTNAIVIYYIAADGTPTLVSDARYDAATGMVVFTTTHFSTYAVGYNKVNFTDVRDTAWYVDAVAFLSARGITSGTTASTFSPAATLTRGQFITLLLRACGVVAVTNPTDNFSDAGDTYYTGYLAAAKKLGITSGVGDNKFAPDNTITRQEMFTLLYNALKVLDKQPSGTSGKTLSDFNDSGSVASWATDAMTELVKTGTVTGSAGALNPTGTTTRAQMAQVLYSLLGK